MIMETQSIATKLEMRGFILFGFGINDFDITVLHGQTVDGRIKKLEESNDPNVPKRPSL